MFSGYTEEVENVSANKGPDGHLGFPIGKKKNANLAKDVEFLRPVKFRQIPLSGLR